MEEARSVAARGGHLLVVTHGDANLLQQALVVVQFFYVLSYSEVVARLSPRQVGAKDVLHGRSAAPQQIPSALVAKDAHRSFGNDQLRLRQ